MKVCVVRKVAVAHCVPPELGLALALPDMSPELNVLLSECFKFDANYRPPFYSTEGDDGPVSQAPLLQFEKLGVAVVLARLRDRGISAGGTTGHAAVVAAVTTGLVEERRRSMRSRPFGMTSRTRLQPRWRRWLSTRTRRGGKNNV